VTQKIVPITKITKFVIFAPVKMYPTTNRKQLNKSKTKITNFVIFVIVRQFGPKTKITKFIIFANHNIHSKTINLAYHFVQMK
jgi:hypothetical protein